MQYSPNFKCPFCTKEIIPTDTFCSSCGNKLPEEDIAFSKTQRIKIYLVSIVVAPFGLYWFFKYFKNNNADKRKTAFVAFYLTIVTLFVVTVISYYYVNQLKSYMGLYDLSGLGL